MNPKWRFISLAIVTVILPMQIAFAETIVISGNTSESNMGDGQTVATGCIEGNGVEKSDDRALGDISKIAFNGAYTVHITIGKEKRFTIRGDENIIDLIAAEIQNDTLQVYPKKSICPRRDLLIDITLETLNYISALGTMDVKIDGIQSDALKIDIDGSSTVSASGKTDSLTAAIGGTGNLQANNLHSGNATLSIAGVGEAHVYVTDRLSADITGVGNIYYSGNPEKVDRRITGLGSVIAQ